MEMDPGSYNSDVLQSRHSSIKKDDCVKQIIHSNDGQQRHTNVKSQTIFYKKLPYRRNNSVCLYKKRNVPMTQAFYLFCTTTSIRGMGKIVRGPIFLRLLWVSFVIIMTAGLVVATTFMVLEYLQYDVNVNTKMILEDASSFPALTICHHHPFSTNAYELWKLGKVQSPSSFNMMLRNMSKELFDRDEFSLGHAVAHFDTMSMYYQNVDLSAIPLLGHTRKTYLTCMSQNNMMVDFEDDCSKLRNILFLNLSHSEYFTCHTFEPNNIASSYEIDSLNIVVSLEPEPDYSVHEQAFIIDTFQRSQGLRVVVHELGSFPDISKDGLHVEPGKMNEIKYQPIRYEKLNSPAKPCVKDNDTKTFTDLGRTYIMDKSQCIQVHKQKQIMEKCQCIFVSLPRPVEPTEDLPYCGKFSNTSDLIQIADRTDCIQDIINDRNYQDYLEKNICFPRCKTLKFDSTVSITKWGATAWHLHWIRSSNQALNQMEKVFNRTNTVVNTTEYDRWLVYANMPNLTGTGASINELFLRDDNFAYVVLQRKTKNTVLKLEKLVTTSYVLLSRFGGLCSVTIGLTAAFVVEFIEFLYKFLSNDDNGDGQRVKETMTFKATTKNPWKKKSKGSKIFENKTKLKLAKETVEFDQSVNDNLSRIHQVEILL